jgi:Uma2 family endonuclease
VAGIAGRGLNQYLYFMSSVIKILPHYTYDDYCKWEGRWELIDGIPYAMSPAPTPKHQRTAAKIIKELVVAIEKSDCDRCVVYNFIDVKISEDTILQPDALIVCGKISKPYLDFPAALVVEILSPATALKDRNTKFDLYQQFGIPYYLVIDADKKELEIYRLEEKKYQQVPLQKEMSFSFQLEESCMIEVNLQAIWE